MNGIKIFAIIFLVCGINCITEWDVFSTKTAYEWAVPTANIVSEENQDMNITYNGRTCMAIYVNGLLRHGSRYPGADDMEAMTELQEKINATKPTNSYDFISTWVNTYPPADEDQLVETGRKEMEGIGQRFASRFSSLFTNALDKVKFVTSRKDRTQDSAQKFYEGMLSFFSQAVSNVGSTVNDSLTRFYEDCNYTEFAIEDNVTFFKEFYGFMNSTTFTNMKLAVETRVGLQNNPLDKDELELMYKMCAFEKYAFDRQQWCEFLTDNDRKIMEYRADLEDYYEKSYGNDISGPLACTMLQHMFNSMDEAKSAYSAGNTQTYTRGQFNFGHSETVVPTLTALELFKDGSPLLATNMATMTNRKFKSSLISPMSANLAFVLYACPGESNGDETTYVVKLLINEEEIIIPKCGQKVCAYDEVRNAYKTKFEPCNKDDLCQYPRKTGPVSASVKLPNQLFVIILAIMLSLAIGKN